MSFPSPRDGLIEVVVIVMVVMVTMMVTAVVMMEEVVVMATVVAMVTMVMMEGAMVIVGGEDGSTQVASSQEAGSPIHLLCDLAWPPASF